MLSNTTKENATQTDMEELGQCKFCSMIKNKRNYDTFITELNYGYVFLNPNQSYKGRVIYILKEHIEDFTEVDNDLFLNFCGEMKQIAKITKQTLQNPLINVAILGNKIKHLHWHIIPRYKYDSRWNGPPWPIDTKLLNPDEYKELALLIGGKLKVLKND